MTRFLNREFSWIEFNRRVLDEALDPGNPLLERLKFLAIVSSNFDEFYMVRVAALMAAARKDEGPDPSGLAPAETLAGIAPKVAEICERQYTCLLDELLPALEAEGITLAGPARWSSQERRLLEARFVDGILPLLTPLGVEEGQPFPSTGNLRVHVAFALSRAEGTEKSEEARRTAIVQVPPNCDRFIRLPMEGPGLRLALLDDVVEAFGHRLFPGWTVRESLHFRVTRDADTGVDEDRDDDFVTAMEEILASRQDSWPVRLVVSSRPSAKAAGRSARAETAASLAPTPPTPPPLSALALRIASALGFEEGGVTRVRGPVELRPFMELASSESLGGGPAFARLRWEPWPPVQSLEVPEGSSVWEEIAQADRLLHVPYESFDPVLRFLDAAADDPAVLAVKMTLYRTSGNSPIVRALTRAARNGKQVAVVMELKARFDEERNIAWANRLEQAGAIVTCGVARLKVHAKCALVVRREEGGGIRRYLHLSTGNYNDKTARLYSDLSLFTCDEELCRSASGFFNLLTGYSAVHDLGRLVAAPFELKNRLIALIDREAQRSTPEAPGLVMAKLNALADTEVIEALYRASQAGVRVRLNVRGVCLLVPGVPGLSENIEVLSVVGRYLEHSRIIRFRNGGNEELFLSSADWMPRNLEKRVELLFPVLDTTLRLRLVSILESYFLDDRKGRRLRADGTWERVTPLGLGSYSVQDELYAAARRRHVLDDGTPRGDLQVRRLPRHDGED